MKDKNSAKDKDKNSFLSDISEIRRRARQHIEKLPLGGGHSDVRETGAVPDRRLEHRVGGLEPAGGVRVDGVPTIVIHGLAVYRRRATHTSSDGQRLAQSKVTCG